MKYRRPIRALPFHLHLSEADALFSIPSHRWEARKGSEMDGNEEKEEGVRRAGEGVGVLGVEGGYGGLV